MFYNLFTGDGNSSAYTKLCKINLYGQTKLIQKEEVIGDFIKIMGSQLKSIVHDYKGNRITSITLIFGHVETASKRSV